jgi:hypothetical protein
MRGSLAVERGAIFNEPGQIMSGPVHLGIDPNQGNWARMKPSWADRLIQRQGRRNI